MGCSSQQKQAQTAADGQGEGARKVASTGWTEPPIDIARAAQEAAKKSSFLEALNDVSDGSGPISYEVKYVQSGKRLKNLFKFARGYPREFFAEMRQKAPVYVAPGVKARAFKKIGKPDVPTLVLVTKHAYVKEALDQNGVFAVIPYQQVMDETVGRFMLGHENEDVNLEKPAMRYALKSTDYARARKISEQLAREAIAMGTNDRGEIDVVKHVSRNVPLRLNGEFFGFPGPNLESMARWSRATQHAMFHNPGRDQKIYDRSVQAGKEMHAYIKGTLLPERRTELNKGRPVNDTVSLLIRATDAHAKHGLPSEERMITDTMGLLVGSVETSAAAIVQSLQYLMDRPMLFEQARNAALSGNMRLFDAYVWEALRYDPINPWVARIATRDYVLGGVTIAAGSLVLIATESAMHDPEAVPNPDEFRLDRPAHTYFHLGYGYHRCLGDDVALEMVPETVRQLILLPNLRRPDANKRIDFADGPFPESWVLKHDANPPKGLFESLVGKVKNANDFLKLTDVVVGKIVKMEDRNRVVATVNKAFSKNQAERAQAIHDLPDYVEQALANLNPEQKIQSCMNKNPKSVEAFPNETDRRNYCAVNVKFRGCYFVERLLNERSSRHAYYHCVFNRGFMNQAEQADFKAKMAHMEMFSFLNE